MNMVLYKKLTVSYADELQHQMQYAFTTLLQGKLKLNSTASIEHIKNKTYHDLTIEDLPIASHVDKDVFIDSIPLFKQFLNDFNLEVYLITLLAICTDMGIHCDLSQPYETYHDFLLNPPTIRSAIIFPVYHTNYSKTVFYKPKFEATYYKSNIGKVISFDKNDVDEIDNFIVDDIYALRVDVPHGVTKYDTTPRVVYSVKFKTNVL
jgi:hypothetical protein